MKNRAKDPRADYYLAADVRELDRLAIQERDIPGFTLMQRAGQTAFNALLKAWPDTRNVLCFCGSGNNAGDGYVIAGLAKNHGLSAAAIAVGNPDKLAGDAALALAAARREGVPITPFSEFQLNTSERDTGNTVIVDALLGTGLSGEVRGDYTKAIRLINSAGCPVLAVDIPSGLCSDTGVVLGTAVQAELTVTFIGRKLGQVVGDGPQACGELVFDDLGVPGDIYEAVSPATP